MICKKKLLEIINEKVISCRLCNLCLTRNNAVPGTGNIDSKILFIGEAPGKNEDKYGLPFVGNAGKVLDQALENAGIQRKDVYITNVVKCRPPGNRVPDKHEINTCSEYLKKEIQIIQPAVICILGATALQSLLNLKNIHSQRGRVILDNDNKYFITYHPAAIIYNNKLKDIFFKDIEKLAKMYKKTETSKRIDDFLSD